MWITGQKTYFNQRKGYLPDTCYSVSMKKTIISVLAIIIIVWLGYAIATRNSEPDLIEQVPVENTGSDSEASGTVTSINTEQIVYDGPSLITIRTEDGMERIIAIRSMGINLCAAQPQMADVGTLQTGDRIEVRGYAEADGIIVPCESADHYLRVVTE